MGRMNRAGAPKKLSLKSIIAKVIGRSKEITSAKAAIDASETALKGIWEGFFRSFFS